MSNLNALHKDHIAWLGQLDFFQDEIKFFQNKLLSAVLDHDHTPMTEEHVTEYRELFFLHLKQIDDLRHLITRHEVMIKREGRENFDENHNHEHVALQMEHVEAALMDMRKRFKAFASHHMAHPDSQ